MSNYTSENDMSRLSIVTVCKNRLAHLKRSLPSFVRQRDTSVVVVDYDCSEGTSAYVSGQHSDVAIARVEDRPYFNNWDARNIGASLCNAELIAFIDADTVVAENFSDWVFDNIQPGTFGRMPDALSLSMHRDRQLNETSNRLAGLIVLPRTTFLELEGYDSLLEGWGAGGDLDLSDRLAFHGHKAVLLPEDLIQEGIQHTNDERTRFHKMTISQSHLIGTLYRTSKNSLMRQFSRELTAEERKKLYGLSAMSAKRAEGRNSAQVEMLVISRNVEGSNYEIRQTITTTVTWSGRSKSHQ